MGVGGKGEVLDRCCLHGHPVIPALGLDGLTNKEGLLAKMSTFAKKVEDKR